MPVKTIQELKSERRRDSRLLGLDLGSKTIGLALSDVTLTIASPLETIKRSKFAKDAARLQVLITEHDVGGLVIGLPVSMDGTEGPRCQSTRDFTHNLFEKIDIDVAFWDERWSTQAVERILIGEADLA
ncbi:MAG: Holliday junction resolvase RuvX, partial [Rhodospirillales bacterium]|nr:Holliday junction resolvase RuvX [Rhodospirillales bacterium]